MAQLTDEGRVMSRLRTFLYGLWIIVVGGCLCEIVSEAIHQREQDRKAREFQQSCADQEKLKRQLEQVQAVQE
jgi:hypothetical protein